MIKNYRLFLWYSEGTEFRVSPYGPGRVLFHVLN